METSHWWRSRTGRVGVGIVLMLSFALATVLPAAAADDALETVVEQDPAVQKARERLADAQRQRDALNASLDEAAAVFEEARGLAERLTAEATQVDEELSAIEHAGDLERESAREQVIGAYLSPARTLSLSEFVFAAPDPGTAMHVMGLIEQMGGRGDATIERVNRTEDLSRDVVRQQHIVTAGAETAARERMVAAGRLQTLLDDATQVVKSADTTLARAEADAEERERERRRLEAERLAKEKAERLARERQVNQLQLAAGSAPLPPVDGKVCPIGAPNGFIDSWGFPRSGGRGHKGVDMFAAYGTPLFAVTEGTAKVGSNRLGGLTVWITADNGDRYYYAHLAGVAVDNGARVRAGDVVGSTGTSGNAAGTPPHLHWEVHPGGGAAVNPYPLAAALCR